MTRTEIQDKLVTTMTQNKMTLDEMMAALAQRGHKVDGDRADGCKITVAKWGAWKVSGRSVFVFDDDVSAVSVEIARLAQQRQRNAAERAAAVDFSRRATIAAAVGTERVAVSARWGAGWNVSLPVAIEDEDQLRALVAAIERVLTGRQS